MCLADYQGTILNKNYKNHQGPFLDLIDDYLVSDIISQVPGEQPVVVTVPVQQAAVLPHLGIGAYVRLAKVRLAKIRLA